MREQAVRGLYGARSASTPPIMLQRLRNEKLFDLRAQLNVARLKLCRAPAGSITALQAEIEKFRLQAELRKLRV